MFNFDLLSSSVSSTWSALGWTVIHFLWQGVLIGLLTAVLLDALPRHKSSSRYLVASGAMLVSFLSFVGTFLWLLHTAAATTSASAWELQTTLFNPLPLAPSANDDRRAFREKIGARLDAIEEMVANGEMSREDADGKIAVIRRRIAARQAEQTEESRTFTRSDYMRTRKKLDGMVAEGKVSREDADTRLGEMRRMIASDRGTGGEEAKSDKFDWAGAKQRIEAAVEAGEITREAADARYKGIKARLKAGGNTAARATARMEYANAEAKIKAMVEAGEVSAEAAEHRLSRMRERIAGDRSQQGKKSKTFTKEEYEAAEKKISDCGRGHGHCLSLCEETQQDASGHG